MKVAYIDCSTGISGDMFLAACCDAGIAPAKLENILKNKLRIRNWRLVSRRVPNGHTKALSVSVEGEIFFKTPGHMLGIIKKSGLSKNVKRKSTETLSLLINAEACVHNVPPAKVHFHELNSIDTIVDITGACLLIELLGIEKLHASPVNIGAAAPATLQMLKGASLPIFSDNFQNELATPTGIAVLARNVGHFGEMPLMKLKGSGAGTGTRKAPVRPSVVKIMIGETGRRESAYHGDEIILLETNIDDMDPRVYPYVMEKVLRLGANDVWLTQVLMKKGRPGIVFSVLCTGSREKEIVDCLMNETTTLGIRRTMVQRYVLERETAGDKKIAYLSNGEKKIKSEFEKVVSQKSLRKRPLYRKLI
jgi:pyridinium-3,5-bisthiocarboxylic acid mononucleotide nickel chelatase